MRQGQRPYVAIFLAGEYQSAFRSPLEEVVVLEGNGFRYACPSLGGRLPTIRSEVQTISTSSPQTIYRETQTSKAGQGLYRYFVDASHLECVVMLVAKSKITPAE